MQLDKTYIATRERDFLDILDLSLLVVRVHFVPLLAAFAVGIIPAALLAHWWIGGFGGDFLVVDEFAHDYAWNPAMEFEFRFGTSILMAYIVAFLIPIATAPATLYLGQAVFLQKPKPKQLFQDGLSALGQLVVFQILVRGALFLLFVVAWLPFATRPYLNEIILLEKNPLRRRDPNQMTTRRRSSSLHAASGGDLIGRAITSAMFGCGAVILVFMALWGLKAWTTGNLQLSRLAFLLYIEISLWSVVCFFTVVRFLSYLDLRIRREGWEVELRMRAEANRMASQLT